MKFWDWFPPVAALAVAVCVLLFGLVLSGRQRDAFCSVVAWLLVTLLRLAMFLGLTWILMAAVGPGLGALLLLTLVGLLVVIGLLGDIRDSLNRP